MEQPIQCPNCRIISEPGTSRCDCGYQFPTGIVSPVRSLGRDVELTAIDPERFARVGMIFGVIYSVAGMPINLLGLAGKKPGEGASEILPTLVTPFLIAAGSYVGSWISAKIYNWVAGKYGGFKVTLQGWQGGKNV